MRLADSRIRQCDPSTFHLEATMNKLVSILLLVGGIVLMIVGINATNSFGSDVSRFFTGSPTDKAIWMLVGGTIAAVVGLVGLLRSRRSLH